MIDRELILKDKAILKMLKSEFVPVAFDQWYTRKQKDVEGKFYRGIIADSPRKDLNATTQGFYIATPGGELIAFSNHRSPDRIREFMVRSLAKKVSMMAKPLSMKKPHEFFHPKLPAGGLVAQVNSKILGDAEIPDRWRAKVFKSSIGRDNLWITAAEQTDLAEGKFPKSLARKIARFHLTDNTRGEPPMWEPNEIKRLELRIESHGVIVGTAHLETQDGKRGYVTSLRGRLKFESKRHSEGAGSAQSSAKKLMQFDLVSKGKFWGEGPYTRNPPKGKFDFAVAIRLADVDGRGKKDVSDSVVPQAFKAAGHAAYRDP